MKFSITASNPDDVEQLRCLLLDASEDLSGPGSRILESGMTGAGSPILILDADHHPVVVSFDLENGEKALIEGLRAIELINTAHPWLSQVYADLQEGQQPAKLIVVSRNPVPGSATILAACPGLRLYIFKLLRINDETALWLDCISADTALEAGNGPAEDNSGNRSANDENGLPALSEEEAAYFMQL